MVRGCLKLAGDGGGWIFLRRYMNRSHQIESTPASSVSRAAAFIEVLSSSCIIEKQRLYIVGMASHDSVHKKIGSSPFIALDRNLCLFGDGMVFYPTRIAC
jgi:hypothetical protein